MRRPKPVTDTRMPGPYRLWLLALASLMGAVAGEARARPAIDIVRLLDVATIGDWVLGCDNSGRCTMVGHAELADPNHVVANSTRSMAIRIAFGPRDGRARAMTFIPDRQLTEQVVDGIDWTGPFVIATPRASGEPLRVPFGRRDLAGREAETVLRRLRAGRPLVATDPVGGGARLRFPYVGFEDAYREVLRRQREIAAWRRQARQADGAVRLVRVVPAIVSGVPAVRAAQMDWCPAGIDARNLSLYDLGARRRLWAHHCPGEGRNRLSRWFLQDGQGDGARVAAFPRDFGPTTADTRRALPNASFDFDFGVLRSILFHAPAEDCGRAMVWGWTGEAFVLIERRIMPVCSGLAREDWIVTYRRPVAGGGPRAP
jgi:hypothetical protein